MAITIQDLYKIYPAKPHPIEALRGVNLQIHRGEIVSLLGVNGAGKTTLSSIIATLHPPTAGDILVEGVSIYKNLLAYRKRLGYCAQKPNFDRILTVAENLVMAGRFYGLSPSASRERAAELMEQFNLTRYSESSATILSGGYRQRLMLARALMHRPDFLILDEPTVALDPQVRRALWETLKALRNGGMTILLTTHYIDEAEALSDRVCILDRGLISLIDTPKNLMSAYNKGRLEDVFLQLIEEKTEL
jgi:ABC-2 type transport system ATP-binding protein